MGRRCPSCEALLGARVRLPRGSSDSDAPVFVCAACLSIIDGPPPVRHEDRLSPAAAQARGYAAGVEVTDVRYSDDESKPLTIIATGAHVLRTVEVLSHARSFEEAGAVLRERLRGDAFYAALQAAPIVDAFRQRCETARFVRHGFGGLRLLDRSDPRQGLLRDAPRVGYGAFEPFESTLTLGVFEDESPYLPMFEPVAGVLLLRLGYLGPPEIGFAPGVELSVMGATATMLELRPPEIGLVPGRLYGWERVRSIQAGLEAFVAPP